MDEEGIFDPIESRNEVGSALGGPLESPDIGGIWHKPAGVVAGPHEYPSEAPGDAQGTHLRDPVEENVEGDVAYDGGEDPLVERHVREIRVATPKTEKCLGACCTVQVSTCIALRLLSMV